MTGSIYTHNVFTCDKALENRCMYFPIHCNLSPDKWTGLVDTVHKEEAFEG